MNDYIQKKIYSNGIWNVIERITEYGQLFSVTRWGSPFFERTFDSRLKAIEWADRRKDDEHAKN